MDQETNLPLKDASHCTFCGECIYCCPTQAWVSKRVGHAVWVGGKHGRFPRWANRVADFVCDRDTFEIIEKSLHWYQQNAKRGERFGTCLDRVGLDKYQHVVLADRYGTVRDWASHGERPQGVKFQVLHTWDREE